MFRTAGATVFALFLLPALAAAQAPPPPDASTAAATLEHPATDELVWNISAGATLSTGNTRAFAGNAATHFAIRRGHHAFVFDFQAIEGLAQVRDTTLPSMPFTDWRENASNVADTARYDYFVTDDDAFFVGQSTRHDRFAGLEARFQAQAGYLRNLFRADKHRLWAEVGYDFTYDFFWPHPFYDPMTGARITGDRYVHSARGFLGYDNHINDALTFTTGLEALIRPYAVGPNGSIAGSDFQLRLNWINELHVKIDARFALGLQFTLRYDSVPPTGKENLDTITVLSLMYTLV